MKNTLRDFIDPEILHYFKRIASVAFFTLIGWGMKIAHQHKSKPLTKAKLFGSMVVAFGIGYLTDMLFTYQGWIAMRPFATIVSAMLSDRIISWMMSEEGFRELLKRFGIGQPKKKKEDEQP